MYLLEGLEWNRMNWADWKLQAESNGRKTIRALDSLRSRQGSDDCIAANVSDSERSLEESILFSHDILLWGNL